MKALERGRVPASAWGPRATAIQNLFTLGSSFVRASRKLLVRASRSRACWCVEASQQRFLLAPQLGFGCTIPMTQTQPGRGTAVSCLPLCWVFPGLWALSLLRHLSAWRVSTGLCLLSPHHKPSSESCILNGFSTWVSTGPFPATLPEIKLTLTLTFKLDASLLGSWL